MKSESKNNISLTDLISSVQLFADIPSSLLQEIVSAASIHTGEPGEVIPIPQNDYIGLLEGEIQLLRDQDKHPVAALKKNSEFDDGIALVYALNASNMRFDRRSKVIFLNGARIDAALSRTAILNELSDQPSVLRKRILWLTEVQAFAALAPAQLIECAKALIPQNQETGSTIITQGETGDNFYIIESGTAEVWREDPLEDEQAQCVATLSSGDVFGEEALLQEGLRNATVRMTNDGNLLKLDRLMFDKFLRASFLEEVEAEAARDLINKNAALIDCRYEMEYEVARIPGAKLMPLHKIRDHIKDLDPQQQHIVYCRTGRRSKAAAFLLSQHGIKAVSVKGGISEWPFEIEGDTEGH